MAEFDPQLPRGFNLNSTTSNCVTLDESFNLSASSFSHLHALDVSNSITKLVMLFGLRWKKDIC